MKRVLLMIAASLSSMAALADQTWSNPVVGCDGARVEDICWNSIHSRPTYPYDSIVTTSCRRQLFVFGGHERDAFLSTRMVPANANGEVILPELKGIPNSPDLKDETFAFANNGRVLFVKRGDGVITVESFRTTQPTGGYYVQQEKVGEYILRGCK